MQAVLAVAFQPCEGLTLIHKVPDGALRPVESPKAVGDDLIHGRSAQEREGGHVGRLAVKGDGFPAHRSNARDVQKNTYRPTVCESK